MSDVPEEPVPTRTLQEIVNAKNQGEAVTDEERARIKDYLWNNPTLRFASRARAAFPEVQAEIVAECATYDTTDDPGYTVLVESSKNATTQAPGLNQGEWWVARFGGDWIDDPANGALLQETAREIANRHFRIQHGCES